MASLQLGKWQKISKLHITGPLWEESTGDQWIPSQRARNMEAVSMPWRHNDFTPFLNMDAKGTGFCNSLSQEMRTCMIYIQSSAVITRSNISRFYTQRCTESCRRRIRLENHNRNPAYLALMGELWGVCCEEIGENWPRYNGTALYMKLLWCWIYFIKIHLHIPSFLNTDMVQVVYIFPGKISTR